MTAHNKMFDNCKEKHEECNKKSLQNTTDRKGKKQVSTPSACDDENHANEKSRKSLVSKKQFDGSQRVLQNRAFCSVFGPCGVLIVLLVLLQAASFMVMQYHLERAERVFFKEQDSLQRQIAKIMEELRKVRIEAEYSKSVQGVSLLNKYGAFDKFDSDDEDYDDFSGAGNLPALINDIQANSNVEQPMSPDLENGSGENAGQWNDIETDSIVHLPKPTKKSRDKWLLKKMNLLGPSKNKLDFKENEVLFVDMLPVKNSETFSKNPSAKSRVRRSQVGRPPHREETQRRYHGRENKPSHQTARLDSYYGYNRNRQRMNRRDHRRTLGRSGRGISREHEMMADGTSSNSYYSGGVPLARSYPSRDYSNVRTYSVPLVDRTSTSVGNSRDYPTDSTSYSSLGSTGSSAADRSYENYQNRRLDIAGRTSNADNRRYDSYRRTYSNPASATSVTTQYPNTYLQGSRNTYPGVSDPSNSYLGSIYNPGHRPRYTGDIGSSSPTLTTPSETIDELEETTQYNNRTDEDDIAADNSWLQLTSYSKISYNAIEEFCARTRSSCPPGPPGPEGEAGAMGPQGIKGEAGLKGDRGSIGPQGPPGHTGVQGPPGRHGRKGERGFTGMTGLDGRDGLPGEPGLDGIPGRNGLDGAPGDNGAPGFNGLPGRDGRNGTDGAIGPKGDKGGRGEVGPRGLTGPRGHPGKNGASGTPGTPGISTWIINGTETKHLLIPPSIPGPLKPRAPGALVVREGDHVRMRCEASGHPPPKIEWRRMDGAVIPTGQWKDATVNSPILNLTHVRRDHTGTYYCEAYNGVPPNANKTFDLEVHFEPYIQVKEWKVEAFNGSSARLECLLESFPEAVTYWQDKNGTIIDDCVLGHRRRSCNNTDTGVEWRSTMVLEIANISSVDYGAYYCVARNLLGVTRGSVELHEIDPRRFKPGTGSTSGLSFGPNPPNYSELYGDLCPPLPVCPECPPPPPPQTHGSGFLYCLNIDQFGNYTYPGYSNRHLDCKLSAVGKPVFNRYDESNYGAWLRDPQDRSVFYGHRDTRYYTTTPEKPSVLFEYENKETYRQKIFKVNYTLPRPFAGNSHVLFNGSFYYHERNSSNVIKYDLLTSKYMVQSLPSLASSGDNHLYTESADYLDLATDENGLWAIYGLSEASNNTVVAKMDPDTLVIEYSWNISLSHHKFGEMFIVCGVLYGIDSVSVRESKIRFALDLYTNKVLDIDLPFTNPFSMTTMLGYNHKEKELYSWDKGNQLNYPISYIDIGYHDNDSDRDISVPEYELDVEIVRKDRNSRRRGSRAHRHRSTFNNEILSNEVY